MPEKTVGRGNKKRRLDARPDRIDFRDRQFQPSLVSLPAEYPDAETIETYLPLYAEKLILDQGFEGACTGFGLAATINSILFARHVNQYGIDAIHELECVSPRMLYQLARIYDEWPGEDYEGSSCRGAMKGWHRHGVCTESVWPYRSRGRARFVSPSAGWQQDAAKRPVGAYYRINKDSIVDMQSAINEVGAIFVSAEVHDGWMIGQDSKLKEIKLKPGETGGHAFALVGYNAKGFTVQNSWGPHWGFHGFAVLTYQDWVRHGSDAWVAVLGAPMKVEVTSRSFSQMQLAHANSGRANWFWRSDANSPVTRYNNPSVEPLKEHEAYEHTVVFANEGRPLNRFLDVKNAGDAVREVGLRNPLKWLRETGSTRLAIYAHGGLTNESDSIKRIRVMAPYFRENGIYPLFITWKTGFLESITGMLEDVVTQFLAPGSAPEQGWFDNLKRQIRDARDRAIEVACEHVLIKSVWVQMKQNAAASARTGSGLHLLTNQLATLKKKIPKLEIHLVGHSAGAILLGHLLDKFSSKRLTVKTCSLYAPACTVDFALKHYGGAHEKNVLSKKRLFCDVMSDERERADSVKVYGKSLLYLVSRALEEAHKMPILGLEGAWSKEAETADMWNKRQLLELRDWRKFMTGTSGLKVHRQKTISNGCDQIALSHGSFDNDVEVITATLERIRGKKVRTTVECLRWF